MNILRSSLTAVFLILALAGCDDEPTYESTMKGADGQQIEIDWKSGKVRSSDGRTGKASVEWSYVPVALVLLTFLTFAVRVRT